MKKYFWLVCSFVWAGLIVYFSFSSPNSIGVEPWFKNQDKLGHFIFYAILSMLLIKTFSQETLIQSPIKRGALTSFFFGVLIEIGQHFFTCDREGDYKDALVNGLGILLIVILIKNFPKYFRFKSIV
jgi:VanZ family protein